VKKGGTRRKGEGGGGGGGGQALNPGLKGVYSVSQWEISVSAAFNASTSAVRGKEIGKLT